MVGVGSVPILSYKNGAWTIRALWQLVGVPRHEVGCITKDVG